MVKTELQEHQKRAVEASLKLKRHFVCIDTGGGKTLVALKMFEQLQNTKPINSCLVLCPKSALVTWQREIRKHSDYSFTIDSIDHSKDINVLSFSRAPIQQLHTHYNLKQTAFIIDEAHVMKSADSDLAKNLRDVVPYTEYIYGLTATPMLNHIDDLYYLVDSLFPGYFGNYKVFMDRYTIRKLRSVVRGGRRVKFWEVQDYQNLEHLGQALKLVMFRHAIEYDLDFKFLEIPFESYERARYIKAAKGFLHLSPRDFIGRLPDLQKVTNGSVDEHGRYRDEPELSSKEKLLISTLKEIHARGEGAIVFTNLLDTMHRFRRIAYHLPHQERFFMSGATNLGDRKNIANTISMDSVLFATMVGGVSLNLQAVNNVIFFDIPWSVGNVMQCIGRISRIDSTYDKQNVYFLSVKGSIDEYKVGLVSSNLGYLRQILGGFGFLGTYFERVRKRTVIAMRRSLLWCKEG